MSYLEKYYINAENELEERRMRNRLLQEERISEAEKAIPQLHELRKQLMASGTKLASILVSDGNMKKNLEQISSENISIQKSIKELLVQNGFKDDYLDPVYSCEKCLDTGIYNNARCSCFMNDVKKFECMDLNSSSAMNLCSFDTFDLGFYSSETDSKGVSPRDKMKRVYFYCTEYARDFHLPQNGILMIGGTGLGKTHLSLAIGKDVIEKGYSVIYGSAPDLFGRIEREHFKNTESSDTLSLLKECDLLIIDDLGTELDSKFNYSTLYNIINTRMNMGKPLVINTNYKLSELQERYSSRITSRLSTMKILLFSGEDIRLIKKDMK